MIFRQILLTSSITNVWRSVMRTCIFLYPIAGLELLKVAIADAGYTDKIKIGMDVAASGAIQHFPTSLI